MTFEEAEGELVQLGVWKFEEPQTAGLIDRCVATVTDKVKPGGPMLEIVQVVAEQEGDDYDERLDNARKKLIVEVRTYLWPEGVGTASVPEPAPEEA